MPYIKIETNKQMDQTEETDILKKASAFTAEMLGKPESIVMATLYAGQTMSFGGETDLTAFVTLKSIGLIIENTADLSKQICEFLEAELGVLPERVFIDFNKTEGKLFGWNKVVF